MSFLAPLFALGLLALGAPILFHLIRRRPKGRLEFSSLMFLKPSPPRFAKRSRPEQILLLILRASALALLALAFMRPFFRSAAPASPADAGQRRVAILIDTSASMRRGDLWQRATVQAREALADCRPTDRVAVFAFDRSLRPVLSFPESATLEPSARRAVGEERVGKLVPTWAGTDLGRALGEALHAVVDPAEGKQADALLAHRIVLISDLQQGARLDALQEREWPRDVELELRTVTDGGGNAGLSLLRDTAQTPGEEKQLRVRIANDPATGKEQFALSWADPKGGIAGEPVKAYVPPGSSRVVRITRPEGPSGQMLELTGDAHDFDNTFFVPDPPRDETAVLFLGAEEAGNPAGLRYYLERALVALPLRKVRLMTPTKNGPSWDEVRALPLVVATGEAGADDLRLAGRYLREGGTLLYVVRASGKCDTLATLAGVPTWEVEEAKVDRYAMLRDIDFDHPLFAPLAGPKFGDFTRIHFWKHRRVGDHLGDARVLARFEGGDPAVLEKPVGKGRLVVLTSGWQPADSELARSSKFFPLVYALLGLRGGQGRSATQYHVGDRVPLPTLTGLAEKRVIRKPDGSTEAVAAEDGFFSATQTPGLYAIESAAGVHPFAVNLDPAESKTSPLPVETLEQMGCRLAGRAADGPDEHTLRQMRDVELERSQKVWRWLVLTAIGVLLVETWLAGRWSVSRSNNPEAVTP
jgi:hypothetical protein